MKRTRFVWLLAGMVVGAGLGSAFIAFGQDINTDAAMAILTGQTGAMITGGATAIITTPAPGPIELASENGLVALGNVIVSTANGVGAHEGANQARMVAAESSMNDASSTVAGGIAQKKYLATSFNNLQDQMTAPGSHTVNACANTLAATTQFAIQSNQGAVGSELNTGTVHWMNAPATEGIAHAREAILTPPQTDVSALIPDGSQQTDVGNGHDDVATPQDSVNEQVYASSILNPYPVPQLPSGVQSKISNMSPNAYPPAVTNYEAAKNIWNAKMSLAASAFSDIASYYAPIGPQNQWTTAAYQAVGEAPPATSISEMKMLDLQVQSRIESPNWYTHVEADTDTGLLREIALMQASIMDINLRQLKTQQLMLALTASQYADHMNASDRQDYMQAYSAVIASEGSW